jgi:hypothetical protein
MLPSNINASGKNRGARIKILFISQVVVEPLVAALSALGLGFLDFFNLDWP